MPRARNPDQDRGADRNPLANPGRPRRHRRAWTNARGAAAPPRSSARCPARREGDDVGKRRQTFSFVDAAAVVSDGAPGPNAALERALRRARTLEATVSDPRGPALALLWPLDRLGVRGRRRPPRRRRRRRRAPAPTSARRAARRPSLRTSPPRSPSRTRRRARCETGLIASTPGHQNPLRAIAGGCGTSTRARARVASDAGGRRRRRRHLARRRAGLQRSRGAAPLARFVDELLLSVAARRDARGLNPNAVGHAGDEQSCARHVPFFFAKRRFSRRARRACAVFAVFVRDEPLRVRVAFDGAASRHRGFPKSEGPRACTSAAIDAGSRSASLSGAGDEARADDEKKTCSAKETASSPETERRDDEADVGSVRPPFRKRRWQAAVWTSRGTHVETPRLARTVCGRCGTRVPRGKSHPR